jgi:hypothetical protein
MVTKQQWETDVINTEIEMEAYRKIEEGYRALAGLPENIEDGQSRLHQLNARKFGRSAAQCREFLEKLRSLENRFENGVLE